jgi:hypothetical protein
MKIQMKVAQASAYVWSLYISCLENKNLYLTSVVAPASAGAYRRLKAGVVQALSPAKPAVQNSVADQPKSTPMNPLLSIRDYRRLSAARNSPVVSVHTP